MHAAGEPPGQVVDEVEGRARIALGDQPRGHDLAVAAERHPRPHVAETEGALLVGRDVLLFGVAKAPNLVALNPLAGEPAQRLILVIGARGSEVHQELEHGPLVHVHHAAGGADGVAFHESGDDLSAAAAVQSVHVLIMLERVSNVKRDLVLYCGSELRGSTEHRPVRSKPLETLVKHAPGARVAREHPKGPVMAEPVGEDRQVKFFFEYDPSYRVVAANGAWMGITPRGDIRIDFFVESLGNPDQVVNLITPEGQLGPELSRYPVEKRFVRRMQVGILLPLDQAESTADLIKKQIADFRKQQEDFQRRREEER